MKSILVSLFLVLGLSSVGHSQVLLSLIFGEKLNSPNIEFGLEGGYNFSTMSGLESKAQLGTFNLGFYFDFKLKNNWYFTTGTVVKGSVGLDQLKENDLTVIKPGATFREDGTYSQRLGYFQVPLTIKYRIIEKFDVQAGLQMGLLHKASLQYNEKEGDTEVVSKTNNKGDFYNFDAGVLVGAGYKLNNYLGMTFSLKYYQGFTNVIKEATKTHTNRSIYVQLAVPIGRGKSAKKESTVVEE